MNAATVAADIKIIEDLFAVIPTLPDRHGTSDPMWRIWNVVARESIARLFASPNPSAVPFGPFGTLVLPFVEMGKINSCDLFGLDELILFAFYDANRSRYRRVVDFGTNIGLHTIIFARCGFQIRSFEPDPHHTEILEHNLELNHVQTDLCRVAVSVESGEAEFTRVLGNTTSSHLSGAKAAPYGKLERFAVKVEAAAPHLAWADLAKIDIEGHEGTLITGLPTDTWIATDAVLEIGTPDNAALVFEHLRGTEINMFAQKIGWQRVICVADMPTSHRDGSLFISSKTEMPWGHD